MKLFRNKLLWTAILYIWLFILYLLTSMAFPNQKADDTGSELRWDYFQHFFLYLLIPVFYFFADGAYFNKFIKKNYQIFLLGLLFVCITELQQLFIASRSYNSIDLALNIGGYIIGIPFGKILTRRLKRE